MEHTHLKIVISGPVGSGKTTLVRTMASELGLPMLDEYMKDIYDAHDHAKACTNDPNCPAADRERAIKNSINTFSAWARHRTRQYAAHQGFIADRWEADLLDVWLKIYADHGYDKITAAMFKDMREKAKLFDYAVVMPLRPPFAEQKNESGLVRKKSFSLRLMSHLLTDGLIRQCSQLPVIFLPNKPMTVEERVRYIQNAINKNATHAKQ